MCKWGTLFTLFEKKTGNTLFYILFSGSKHDNLIPFLSRKCRAFALDNNEKAPEHQDMLHSEKNTGSKGDKIDRPCGTIVDEDEDETQKPDLNKIIRSLDTPPPS